MGCGCAFGRVEVDTAIKEQVEGGSTTINCPRCQTKWTLPECELAAGYTKTRMNEIKEQLSQNYLMEQNTIVVLTLFDKSVRTFEVGPKMTVS